MKPKVVLISGRICTWKTNLAEKLCEKRSYQLISTSSILRGIAEASNKPTDRISLQKLGDEMDRDTNSKWVFDNISTEIKKATKYLPLVVDHIRHKEQLVHFRKQSDFEIEHVHLFAKEFFLRNEFEKGQKINRILIPKRLKMLTHFMEKMRILSGSRKTPISD